MSRELPYFPPRGAGKLRWYPKSLNYSNWKCEDVFSSQPSTLSCYASVDFIEGVYKAVVTLYLPGIGTRWVLPKERLTDPVVAITLAESTLDKTIETLFTKSWHLEAIGDGWNPPLEFWKKLSLEVEGCEIEYLW